MTNKQPKKMHVSRTNFAHLLGAIAGAVEALLLARLLARSLAARPDNPSVMLLYSLTNPLVAPLGLLDRGQPLAGAAAFELSTLILAIIVPSLAGLAWFWLVGRATSPARRSS